jgi:PiT family inorganic phosphate transporter
MSVVLLVLAALALAWANGANDNFKAVATVYGSRTLGYRASLGLATAAQLAGSLASVLLAGALLKAFGGKGLVPDAVVGDPAFLTSVGLGAAATVLVATRLGLPISTTHALIGGLVGAGLVLSPEGVAVERLGAGYFLPLLTSPLLALLGAAAVYPLAHRLRRRFGVEPTTVVRTAEAFEPVVERDGVLAFAATGLPLTVEQRGAVRRTYDGAVVGVSAKTIVDALHQLSAFALGFARGLNDTPKVLGLLVAARWSGVSPRVALIGLATAMAAGGLLQSRRLAHTLGQRITSMNDGQGLVASAVSSGLVIVASLLGSPVSTTHVSTGAIFGIGLWTGDADRKVIGGIVLAWVATLPLGAALAGLAALALG